MLRNIVTFKLPEMNELVNVMFNSKMYIFENVNV